MKISKILGQTSVVVLALTIAASVSISCKQRQQAVRAKVKSAGEKNFKAESISFGFRSDPAFTPGEKTISADFLIDIKSETEVQVFIKDLIQDKDTIIIAEVQKRNNKLLISAGNFSFALDLPQQGKTNYKLNAVQHSLGIRVTTKESEHKLVIGGNQLEMIPETAMTESMEVQWLNKEAAAKRLAAKTSFVTAEALKNSEVPVSYEEYTRKTPEELIELKTWLEIDWMNPQSGLDPNAKRPEKIVEEYKALEKEIRQRLDKNPKEFERMKEFNFEILEWKLKPRPNK